MSYIIYFFWRITNEDLSKWAYDRDSHVGRLDKGLDEALENGWTVIDMKSDWKVVYPFEIEQSHQP